MGRGAALEVKRQRGRPAAYAIIKTTPKPDAARQSESDDDVVSDNQHDNLRDAAT